MTLTRRSRVRVHRIHSIDSIADLFVEFVVFFFGKFYLDSLDKKQMKKQTIAEKMVEKMKQNGLIVCL